MTHIPVLTKEVLAYLDPKPNENFIDGTVGQAGHALLILEKNGPSGKVLGIDLDAGQIENAKNATKDFKDRVVLVHDSYAHLKEITHREGFTPVSGILLDLGYSSWQIENSIKGFSFNRDEVLDMRFNEKSEITAEKIVNEYREDQLQIILQEYGEESFARKIAQEIVAVRQQKKIHTTFQLKEIIERVIPGRLQHGRIHCATKTFQALRIAVNNELIHLQNVLPEALSVLAPGGRLVIISFHSLEDRIVKNFFRDKEKEGQVTILTKKPIEAGASELSKNPRAKSAKLRAIVKR